MINESRLRSVLLFMRITVFAVMLVWTVDKFLRPEHAASVYGTFYFLDGLDDWVMVAVGVVELLIIAGFLVGVLKRFTYGAVLLFHAVSTLSSFKQYLNPFEGSNILFYAAWPMLAACVALYVLRNHDTYFSLGT